MDYYKMLDDARDVVRVVGYVDRDLILTAAVFHEMCADARAVKIKPADADPRGEPIGSRQR